MALTLLGFRNAVLERCALENTGFVSPASLTEILNHAWFELYDELVSALGDDYFLQRSAWNPAPGTSSFDLTTLLNPKNPADDPAFYKLRRIEILHEDRWHALDRYQMAELQRSESRVDWDFSGMPKYAVEDSAIQFDAPCANSPKLTIWWIPLAVPLVLDTDTLPLVAQPFELFLVWTALLEVLQKEETDAMLLTQKLNVIKERIKRLLPRDRARPMRTSLVWDRFRRPGVRWTI